MDKLLPYKEYVVGFGFDPVLNEVLLIEKNRPEWQKGKYNGVGGHIEEGETPDEAMEREFEEETGITCNKGQWEKFCVLNGNDFCVYFFRSDFVSRLHPTQMTDEKLQKFKSYSLPINVLPHLYWNIPMANKIQRKDWPFLIYERSDRAINRLSDNLPKKFNGADLCAVREDFGWWVGYDSDDLSQEISATGKTLDEAFTKLDDYWFKSSKAKEEEK